MTEKDNDFENGISSVKYFALTDENSRMFYDEWRFKTMTIIRKKGWDSPFDDVNQDIPTKEEAEDSSASDESKKLYKSNMEAYYQILMGCSGIPLGLVQRAKGNVREAIKNLDEKYAQEDVSNLTELIQQFTACKLEDTDTDPDSWFLKLDKINAKMKAIEDVYEKKDYDLKAHMLGNLPEGYEDVKRKIHGKESSYSVRQIEKEIVNEWKRYFQRDKKNSLEKNIAMPVSGKCKGNYKKFKGKCRQCGKIGHKVADCRSAGTVKKKGVCFECGEEGHYVRDCPKKSDQNEQTGMFVGMLMCKAVTQELPVRRICIS